MKGICENRVVIVTGAAQGIGRALRSGVWRVVCVWGTGQDCRPGQRA